MKKVIAVIEKGSDGGYSIYTQDLSGVYGYGLNEEEAKSDFEEVLSAQLEYMGKAEEAHDIEYRYDFSGFFKSFPFFNVSELARELGVNASLFRRYKSGSALASERQKEKIQKSFERIVHKLQEVKF